MIRGIRGMNPKQMMAAMRKMGIKMEEINDVNEVIVKTKDKDYIVHEPTVTMIDVHGEVMFQISGRVEVVEKAGALPAEDIKLVAEQANVSEELAKKALEDTGGDIAEAIIKLMEKN